MAKTVIKVRFEAKLFRPGGPDKGAPWTFLNLPDDASQQLPTRSMISVEGTFGGKPFYTTLQPDGNGGHWMKVAPELGKAGDVVEVEIEPMAVEPEPEVPEDLQAALDAASPKAQETWAGTTPLARRDWIAWVVSGKKAETRGKRIGVACSKLNAGSKRPCCFDRSGMFSKEFFSPIPDTEDES